MDLYSSFHQIPLAEEPRPYTAFSTDSGFYQSQIGFLHVVPNKEDQEWQEVYDYARKPVSNRNLKFPSQAEVDEMAKRRHWKVDMKMYDVY